MVTNLPQLVAALVHDVEHIRNAVDGLHEHLADVDNSLSDTQASLSGLRSMVGGDES